jgi:hypothetical protein
MSESQQTQDPSVNDATDLAQYLQDMKKVQDVMILLEKHDNAMRAFNDLQIHMDEHNRRVTNTERHLETDHASGVTVHDRLNAIEQRLCKTEQSQLPMAGLRMFEESLFSLLDRMSVLEARIQLQPCVKPCVEPLVEHKHVKDEAQAVGQLQKAPVDLEDRVVRIEKHLDTNRAMIGSFHLTVDQRLFEAEQRLSSGHYVASNSNSRVNDIASNSHVNECLVGIVERLAKLEASLASKSISDATATTAVTSDVGINSTRSSNATRSDENTHEERKTHIGHKESTVHKTLDDKTIMTNVEQAQLERAIRESVRTAELEERDKIRIEPAAAWQQRADEPTF